MFKFRFPFVLGVLCGDLAYITHYNINDVRERYSLNKSKESKI